MAFLAEGMPYSKEVLRMGRDKKRIESPEHCEEIGVSEMRLKTNEVQIMLQSVGHKEGYGVYSRYNDKTVESLCRRT